MGCVNPMEENSEKALPWFTCNPRLVAPALIAVLLLVAYGNSFQVPLLLDDRAAISTNHSLLHLDRFAEVLLPPRDSPTAGRPFLNFTFALNHAWSGEEVWSYHAVNLAVHILATLALFAVVRRTLELPSLRPRFGQDAVVIAGVSALLWGLHPVQTESVTYLSQRAESLMGLFYLLTLYGFIRSMDSPMRLSWMTFSVVVCFFGMATKEVMITAPVVVLIYDCAFCAGSFSAAWVERGKYYAALAGSWLLLGGLMIVSRVDGRIGGDIGQNVEWWRYAVTEARVIVGYVGLALWPHPLVFDYGSEILATRIAAELPYVVVIFGAVTGAALAWHRSKTFGFLLVVFFVLLAPTSSVVPIALQPMAESRMYLPLATIMTFLVGICYLWKGRVFMLGAAIYALVLGTQTFIRNNVYRSELGLWADTVAKRPDSARAQNNLGWKLSLDPSRATEAIAHLEVALRLKPTMAEAHYNLATVLSKLPGRVPDAFIHYERAVALLPSYTEAHAEFAAELAKIPSRMPEAILHYQEALRLNPGIPEVHYNLANILAMFPDRAVEAVAHYEAALRVQPDFVEAHGNLADLLVRVGRMPEALSHYQKALQLRPNVAGLHEHFALALAREGRTDQAIEHLEIALRLDSASSSARTALERIRALPKQ